MARFSPPREDGPYQFEIRREWEEPLGAEVKNMVVQRVLPGSPAYRAGLRPGMAVLRVGGRRVETVAELSRLVGAAGERFTITANANGALADDSPRSSGRRYVPDPHDGGDETLRLVRGEYHPKSPGRGRSVSSEVAPEPFSGPPTPRTGRKQFRQQHETYAPSFWEEQNVRSHSPYITENPIHRSPPHQSPGLDGTMQWDRVPYRFQRGRTASPTSTPLHHPGPHPVTSQEMVQSLRWDRGPEDVQRGRTTSPTSTPRHHPGPHPITSREMVQSLRWDRGPEKDVQRRKTASPASASTPRHHPGPHPVTSQEMVQSLRWDRGPEDARRERTTSPTHSGASTPRHHPCAHPVTSQEMVQSLQWDNENESPSRSIW